MLMICTYHDMLSRLSHLNKRKDLTKISLRTSLVAMARPSSYTPAIANKVCGYIMAGLTLRQLEGKPGLPTWRTICNWLLNNEEFFQQHARARQVQAWGEVDEMLLIADECTPKNAHQARLRVDVRKFRAERFNRAAFGDKREVKHTGELKVGVLVAHLTDKLDTMLGTAPVKVLTDGK